MWDTFTCRIILNGIVVKVGCQRIFFPTADALRDALNDYIEDPEKSIKRWRDTPFQKISEGCGQVEVAVSSSAPPPPSDRTDAVYARLVNNPAASRPLSFNEAASESDGSR